MKLVVCGSNYIRIQRQLTLHSDSHNHYYNVHHPDYFYNLQYSASLHVDCAIEEHQKQLKKVYGYHLFSLKYIS